MKGHATIAALLTVGATLGEPAGALQNCSDRTLVTELGRRVRAARQIGGTRRIESINAGAANVRYMRVRIEQTDPGSCRDWLLVLRHTDGRILQTLTAADFDQDSVRWTLRLTSTTLRISLIGCPTGAPLFALNEHLEVQRKSDKRFFSAKGPIPDWEGLYRGPAQFVELGDALGFFTSAWEQDAWVCSGVLLAKDLFLTNWHCGGPNVYRQSDGTMALFPDDWQWNSLVVRDALVDLSWDDDPFSQDFSVQSVVERSVDLDFALLRLTPMPTAMRLPAVHLAPSSIASGDALRLLHHPLGEPKQISHVACRTDDAARAGWKNGATTEFTHTCDTEGGSSGGPVFNQTGELVGLHHLGFTFAADCSSDRRNKAIHIGCIINALPDAVRREIAPGRTFVCPAT